jgi:NAD(P)-dependent dehydrogenase (short-subunit alcohol dehydrogenase family)
VVDEIAAAGGQAVANSDDITDWEGGKRLMETAVDTFGNLHVLVNNAGILRDRVLVNMSEEDWDSVIKVHL